MLCDIPTQSAVKLYVFQVRRSIGSGARSPLVYLLSPAWLGSASVTRPSGSRISSCPAAETAIARYLRDTLDPSSHSPPA